MSELPVDQLLTVNQAIAILDGVDVFPRVVRLPLLEALGMRLAEDVFADRDYPPFDKAVMDGFAIRSGDASVAGMQLTLVETIAAGQVGKQTVGHNEAAAIMTGAPVPAGADAVVPVERTSRQGNRITIHSAVSPGQAIARLGSDTSSGRLLLSKGTPLGPAQLGVVANVGLSTISVFDKPTVALLATGDELIEIDQVPTGAQIRNSNSVMMHALLLKLGCRVRDLGVCRDDPNRMKVAIADGLTSDALFITGGMSMGERDFVPGLFKELGLVPLISKLRIKPGKPFVFARGSETSDRRLAFGLPGNPVSAYVCTLRLANRVLMRLAGGLDDGVIKAIPLIGHLPANGPRESYLPAFLRQNSVEMLPSNGSADLFTFANANALIIRSENALAVNEGEIVQVIELYS